MTVSQVALVLSHDVGDQKVVLEGLAARDDVHCFPPVFDVAGRTSPDQRTRETNFFAFVEEYARGDITRTFPDRVPRLFADYVEYLRCFSECRHLVIPIAYEHTGAVASPLRTLPCAPVLDLAARAGVPVAWVTSRDDPADGDVVDEGVALVLLTCRVVHAVFGLEDDIGVRDWLAKQHEVAHA